MTLCITIRENNTSVSQFFLLIYVIKIINWPIIYTQFEMCYFILFMYIIASEDIPILIDDPSQCHCIC